MILFDQMKEFADAVRKLSHIRRRDFQSAESLGPFSFLSLAIVMLFISLLVLAFTFLNFF